MRGSQGRAVSPDSGHLAPPVGEDVWLAWLVDDRIQFTQRFGAVQHQCSEDTRARKSHGASGTVLCRTETAMTRQTRLEGLVAKSATEWGSAFNQEESFWLLNLKIWYLWKEPFHKLCWKKKYFDFFFKWILGFEKNSMVLGGGRRSGTHT